MARPARLTRKAFFVDPRALRRAQRVLGVRTESEALRVAVERIAEMETFWRFMEKSRATLRPGSIEEP
jgi:hypothetical protein